MCVLTAIGQTLNRGIHQLSYIAKDAEGNTAKCDFRIHILSEYFYACVVFIHHSIFILFYTLFCLIYIHGYWQNEIQGGQDFRANVPIVHC